MKQKVAITERAATQRINRVLSKNGERLCKARGSGVELSVGQFYIVDVQGNYVARQDIDPAELGRSLGVIKQWETISGVR